ncbi:MAG: hypothetical protein L6Q99_18165 [Planctomycetes bacterium]|nr:hypothetical protein [Planctomycetota bacterium]
MATVRIAITGFGPFVGSSGTPIELNPSREIARALASAPPAGVDVVSTELSVTFDGAPRELAAWLASLEPAPRVLLGLGVQSGGGVFRLERRARGRLVGDRRDNAGREAGAATADLEGERETELDFVGLEVALRAGGAAGVVRSNDAGGFVCERVYFELLRHGERLGVPALFLHLPRAEQVSIEAQTRVVAALVAELARRVASRAG